MKRIFNVLLMLVPIIVQAQVRTPTFDTQPVESFNVESLRQSLPNSNIDHAKAVQSRHETNIISHPGVIGIGVGLSSYDESTPVIKVYVDITGYSIARDVVPSDLEGVQVEVVESEPFEAYDPVPPRGGFPVLMGQSTSPNGYQYSGTIGFRAHRIGDPSSVGFITNNHVAASDASYCATSINPAHMPQFQMDQCNPSIPDSGTGSCLYNIGNLTQVVPLFMGGSFVNTVDAAFVESSSDLISDDVVGLEPISNENIMDPFLMLPVTKTGRTTGTTAGIVESVNTTLIVNYGCGVAKFVNQAIVTPGDFSAPGDSGSAIWINNTDPQLVGLLFAGNSFSTVINPITAVLGALAVVPDFGVGSSIPPNQVSVPNVIGMTESDAISTIQSSNLVVGVITPETNPIPAGTVIGQAPVGGTQVERESAVNLTVSTGPQQTGVIVPNVVGMTFRDGFGGTGAEDIIGQAGLTVGTVNYVQHPTILRDVVISQTPTSGTQVEEGSAVNLEVSIGILPTFRVEAENYTAQYGVQIECGTPASGGCNIGYIREGDWSQYAFDFLPHPHTPVHHTYTLRLTYAVWNSSSPRSVSVRDMFTNVETTYNLPVTGSTTQSYGTIAVPFVVDSDGYHDGGTELRFNYHGGSMNIDYFELIP